MHMRIDPARHDEFPRGVDDICIWMLEILSNQRDLLIFDQDVCLKGIRGGDEGAMLDQDSHSMLHNLFVGFLHFLDPQ